MDEQDIQKSRAGLEIQRSKLDKIKSRMNAEELELKCLSIEDVRKTYEKELNEIEQQIKKIEAVRLIKENEHNELDIIFAEHEKVKNKLESDILEVKREKTEVDKFRQDVYSLARALKLKQEELKELSENAKNKKGELINIHRLQVTITNLNKELEKREAYIATLEKEAVDLKDKLKSKNKQTRQIDIQTKLLHDNIKLQDAGKSVI
jgi:chromosome segregation ATPase